MFVQPYLFFEGRCDEALAFYRQAIGAEVEMLMRYRESPPGEQSMKLPPGSGDKVMHCSFRVGDSVLMASDGMCSGTPRIHGISLSLTADDPADAERRFAALADGGSIMQPLIETFFSPRFGMLTDRYGVSWMVVAAHAVPKE